LLFIFYLFQIAQGKFQKLGNIIFLYVHENLLKFIVTKIYKNPKNCFARVNKQYIVIATCEKEKKVMFDQWFFRLNKRTRIL